MKNRKGFTITELVIVIAVIAILAAVLIPTFSGMINKANSSAVTQETRAAITVLLSEKNGQIPSDTYVVYVKSETEQIWFKYENGKLGDQMDSTAVATVKGYYGEGDELYAKGANSAIFTKTEGENEVPVAVTKSLEDLSAKVEIFINK